MHPQWPVFRKIFYGGEVRVGGIQPGLAKSAPALILSAAKKTSTNNGSPNGYGLHDAGAATAYLSLQASVLGLHTHSMAGFDHEAARKAFNVPDG